MRRLTLLMSSVVAILALRCVPAGTRPAAKPPSAGLPSNRAPERVGLQTQRIAQPTTLRNQVTHPLGGDVLAESKGWIHLRKKGTASWTQLIPGRCPQWCPDAKRFYYFLDVGYDGWRAQLWSADVDGEARLRMSVHDYFIQRSPVVSQDGRKLAWHYSTCGASNLSQDIRVLELRGEDTSEEKVVLRYPQGTTIESIRWTGKDLLAVTVHGQVTNVDTKVKGQPPIP